MEPERILVVDDDEGLLNLMVFVLNKGGYQVEAATDGYAALKILASQPPVSVLVTDLMMPGMSGLELLRQAKKMDEHIEVVVVTAASDLESAVSAMRAYGAYDYLVKPFGTMNVLALSVERALMHRRLLQERLAMQMQIAHEAEMLRALIANTGDAILSANAAGILQIANPAAVRLLGNPELEGKPALESLPQFLSSLISNWQTAGGGMPVMVEMPWSDGTVQLVSLTAIREAEGRQQGWVAVLRDVTHLKQLEAVKNQLLVEAANKIRIPLAQAMNSLVELNIHTAQNSQLSEIVYRLTQTWMRIQEWGDDIHVLTRIDAQASYQPVAVDLAQVIQDLSQTQAGKMARSANIRLSLDITADLPAVQADPELLRRLLQGLLNRAVARSEPGDVIHIEAKCQDHQVWVSVSDDGPPVSDTDLPHIFDKTFVELSNRSGFTGLEMALVKTIIDRMGGQVMVGGQTNRGSTILVCLPCLTE